MQKTKTKKKDLMLGKGSKSVFVLSEVILILMVVASAGGLFIQDLYQDNLLVTAAWYGNDIITLIIAVPLFILSLVFSKRGSESALLVCFGMLFYTLYNYAFYLFGAAFNSFFLIYVALFSLSIWVLILGLSSLRIKSIAKRIQPGPHLKWVSGYMMFVALLLGLFHILLSADYIFTEKVPEVVINIGHPTNVISALDLSFVVSVGLIGALWLWRGVPWGFVIAVLWNVKSGVYLIALSVATVRTFQVNAADNISQLALWLPISIGCIISSVVLLRNMRTPND